MIELDHKAYASERLALIQNAHIQPLKEAKSNFVDRVEAMELWFKEHDGEIPAIWQDPDIIRQSYSIAHGNGIRLPPHLVIAGLTHPLIDVQNSAMLSFRDLPEQGKTYVIHDLQTRGFEVALQ